MASDGNRGAAFAPADPARDIISKVMLLDDLDNVALFGLLDKGL